MNARKQQAKTIMFGVSSIAQTDSQTFTVKSTTTSDKFYTILRTGNGLVYECSDHLECIHKFTSNFGFEKTLVEPATITGAMQMYFTGMSVHDIVNHYEMMGIKISNMVVYNWIFKYSEMVENI